MPRPVSEIDIYRSAQLMIKSHGTEAIERANRRIKDLELECDKEGCAVWHRIKAAIRELLKQSPGDDDQRH